jgi:hypothetical protein
MLRLLLSIAAVAAILCDTARPGHAYVSGDAPWCAVINRGAGQMAQECYYWSVEECTPNVLGGNRGFCNLNPYWRGSYPARTAAPLKYPKRHVQQQ